MEAAEHRGGDDWTIVVVIHRPIRRHLGDILASIATGLSNGPIEGLNEKIRTIARRVCGFHSASSLIFLCCSGLTLHPVVSRNWIAEKRRTFPRLAGREGLPLQT